MDSLDLRSAEINLVHNAVGGRVDEVEKVTPTDPMPMGVATEEVAIMKQATCSFPSVRLTLHKHRTLEDTLGIAWATGA